MRYSIYFTPPAHDALTLHAARWLGRDAFRDAPVPQPTVEGFDSEEIRALTDDPRRYGFHATLKAPFELRDGCSEDELVDAFDAFAASIPAFDIAITLGRLGPFFALVPAGPSDELQALADESVRHFERFRASLSPADIARRRPESLPASQRDNLERWGYPYVFGDFRFHMTLTGPVPADRQPQMQTALAAWFAPYMDLPLSVSHLSLFVEPERGSPFVMNRIVPLSPQLQRKTA